MKIETGKLDVKITSNNSISATLKNNSTISADISNKQNIEMLVAERGLPGRGIISIEKTATEELVDTYTITYTDNTTSTFTVTNGFDGDENYEKLNNLPSINQITLVGNKTSNQLGLQEEMDSLTNLELDDLIKF